MLVPSESLFTGAFIRPLREKGRWLMPESPASTASKRMDDTPDEVTFRNHYEQLLRTASIPIVMNRQGRRSLSRLISAYRLGEIELHCQLTNGRLHITYRNPWNMRHIRLVNLIADAIALLGSRSLPPFYVNTGDRPGQTEARSITVFATCAADGYADVAAPDFIFNGWPEAKFVDFDAKARSLAEASAAQAIHQRAFWTGRGDIPARAALVEMSIGRPDAIDAVDALPNFDQNRYIYLRNFKPMEEQLAQYRYMVDVEGIGYSGRLKLLLHARRAVLLVDRPYREFFHDEIEPFRHYVPVERYSSDIIERVDWLRSNPAREAEIVSEARDFARRRLTRQAAVTIWADLLEKHLAAGGNLRSAFEHTRGPMHGMAGGGGGRD
jgi:hypothetical protein